MELNQYGGFLPLSILGSIGQAFGAVFNLLGNAIYVGIVYLGPLIFKFLKFSVISSVVLSVFGFFGVLASLVGIFYFYFKFFKDIQSDDSLFRNWSRSTQGLPPLNQSNQ